VSNVALRAAAAAVLSLALVAGYGTSRRSSPVLAADESRPPARLSETGLWVSGRPGTVDTRNRPFAPQYPLWTDGAAKRRFVYLPEGATIEASSDHAWEFPVGTRFWKEFGFGGRKVETRMLWKATRERWVVAAYVWNDDQTDAVLAPEAGVPGVAEIAPGRRHSVPARTDCVACHGSPARPLGFGALQLSGDRDPNAIHGEPSAPGMLTLPTLVADGLLSPDRSDLVRNPPRVRASSPRTRTALGYLAANCGSCHDGSAAITANLPPLGYADVAADGDAVAEALVARATRFQVAGVAEGASVAVDPDAPDHSALVARMRSRRPSSQMPPLGTVVRDEEAIDAIVEWIRTDLAPRRSARR
jgi:cytochrome c553